MKKIKQALSLVLCSAMLLSYFPTVSFAVEEGGLCAHHLEHTDTCGYSEDTQVCTYLEAGCPQCQEAAQEPTEAVVPESSVPQETEAAEADLCDHHPEHTAECGYEEGVAPCAYEVSGCPQCLGIEDDIEEQTVSKTFSVGIGADLVTSLSEGTGMTRTYQFYYGTDEERVPLDDNATIAVTDRNGYETSDVTVKKVDLGASCYDFTFRAPGDYLIKGYLNGEHIGTVNLEVTGSRVPGGLNFSTNNNGQLEFSSSIRLNAGESQMWYIYYDGTKLPGDAALVYDTTALMVTPMYNADVWEIKALKAGEYTICYTGTDGQTFTLDVFVNEPGGSGGSGVIPGNQSLNLDEFELDPGLYFVIFDNHPIFTPVMGLTYPGNFMGPIVLADKHGNNSFLTWEEHGANLSVSDGLDLQYLSDQNKWKGKPLWADAHTITYRNGNEVYELTVNAQNRGQLYAKVKGTDEWTDVLDVTEDVPTVVKFGWMNSAGKMIEALGTISGSNDLSMITRDMNTQEYTVVVEAPDINAHATYHYDDYNIYMMQIRSHEAKRLALMKQGAAAPVYDYIGTVGQETEVEILFGLPSSGLESYNGALTVSEQLELTKDNDTGKYKLKILSEGEHTITCTENGETYTIRVTGLPQDPLGSGGSLFAISNNSSVPVFYAAITAGNPYHLQFCFGSYGDYQVLDRSRLNLVGDSVELEQDGNGFILNYKHNGQTLIQCTDDQGVVHNFAVKCFEGLNELGMAWYSNQSVRASVNLPYKGKTVTVGPAYCTNEKMVMWAGNSFNHTEDMDFELREEIVVGAMYAGEGYSVTEPVEKKFYQSISNLRMSFLTYTNTTDPSAGRNVELQEPTTITWKDLPLQMQKIQGSKGQYFESELLVNYDVDLDGVRHRFYHVTDLNYRRLPENKVSVDITDTKVLNTLLSNSYCLLNYLKAQDPTFVYQGGNLTLTLPEHSYDGLIVSQLILPGSTDVLATFTLKGNGTTVPGIYSKGFLYGVDGINFVADPNVKMTFNGEEFTCGLLVDNTRSGFQPPSGFDLPTLRAYHPEFQDLTDSEAQAKFESYKPSVPTSGNSYNLGSVTNCTFTDFEYAMRTDAGGFVHGSSGCTIKHCKYGVFINARGASTLHTDGRANTIWRDNIFVENWVPVRIVDLPDDLSPYYIRFIDNQFLRNHGDFWITTGGKYYFQRNYFSGKWNQSYTGHWTVGSNDNWLSPKGITSPGSEDTARAAIIVPDDTIVVTNPCRSTPESKDNLLIFDTDSQQYTAIFQNDADNMLVSAESIGKLTTEVEIPVLDSKGETIGSWRIEGGEQ